MSTVFLFALLIILFLWFLIAIKKKKVELIEINGFALKLLILKPLMALLVFVIVKILVLILSMVVLLIRIHQKILDFILVLFVTLMNGILFTKFVVLLNKLSIILNLIWESQAEKLEIAKLLNLTFFLPVLLNFLLLLLLTVCLNLNTSEVLKNLLVNIWFSMFKNFYHKSFGNF